ncbi:hypothetical protein [Klebsiella pneumoniae]
MAIGNTQALRGHLSGQTPVDNVISVIVRLCLFCQKSPLTATGAA